MAVDLTKIKVGDYLAVVGPDRQEKHVVTKVKGGVISTKCFIGERLGDHDYRFNQDRGLETEYVGTRRITAVIEPEADARVKLKAVTFSPPPKRSP